MSTDIRHGRKREKRGAIKSFDELPERAQESFKIVAKEIIKLDDTVNKVYVFGSHFWGFWDDLSDYDVLITSKNFPMSKKEFKSLMKKKYDFDVDVMGGVPDKQLKEFISIPL